MTKRKNKIFIIGYMGSGKSTVARRLSEITGLPWVDTDDKIAQKLSMSVSEIFQTYGEKRFRREEKKLLKELIHQNNLIISCGGGMPCDDSNISMMLEEGIVVWVKASVDTIIKRVSHDGDRPLLARLTRSELRKKISTHLKERLKYYEQADIKVWNRNEIDESAERVLNYLKHSN